MNATCPECGSPSVPSFSPFCGSSCRRAFATLARDDARVDWLRVAVVRDLIRHFWRPAERSMRSSGMELPGLSWRPPIVDVSTPELDNRNSYIHRRLKAASPDHDSFVPCESGKGATCSPTKSRSDHDSHVLRLRLLQLSVGLLPSKRITTLSSQQIGCHGIRGF